MDSFYCPIPPCPTKRPILQPSVPDVSLLMNVAPINSYRGWKCSQTETQRQVNVHQQPILKKQVRFDNPTVNQNFHEQCTAKPDHQNQFNKSDFCTLPNQSATPPMRKAIKNKQFNEIYMANIPNRHLDLSLIDVVKPIKKHQIPDHQDERVVSLSDSTNETVTKKVPTTYKEFLEMQKCENEPKKSKNKVTYSENCITDIFNYSSPRVHKNEKQLADELKFKNETKHKTKFSGIHKLNLNDSQRSVQTGISSMGMNQTQNLCIYEEKIGNGTEPCNQVRKSTETDLEQCGKSLVPNKRHVEEPTSEDLVKNDEPTVKDLLKIIQQQNEQLLILQQQVSSLLNCRENTKRIEAPSPRRNIMKDNIFTDVAQQEVLNSARSTPRKATLPKFSIDLMTSFEVSFRPQQNMYHQRKQRDFIANEPKIQEITEAESNFLEYDKTADKKMPDTSLHLQEPINVRETCPSPEPSIQIDMKDYESSDEDNDNVTSRIGATFYRNLMDQVNKIIQSAQNQTNTDCKFSKTDEWKDRTMSKVRDATIKHLRKIGVNFSTIDEVDSDYTNKSDDSTLEQISFAVKQLLMKYLPDEQLAKLATENAQNTKKNSQEKIVLNSRAPEFSFATIQFMKKYNLIAGESPETHKKLTTPSRPVQNKVFKRVIESNPKILDISALRQQPKLL